MKKISLFLILIIVLFLNVNAQFSLLGQLKDTTNETVPAATVMLLNTKDSSLINYTTSDSYGKFTFKNIKKNNYILKISHITYMPHQIYIEAPENEKEINLGIILLKPIANFLMEVVIKEAKAPIFIKGDTVEYDATTFKVPPGSTVEDLLRRLPGIDVDANGAITTQGKDVKTVYVDGKAFFGTDPKTVTQNLDAQAVKRVQVYNEKTEQEKITGISDGTKEKVMNLELKNEYKKGYFGKAMIGYGWGENAANRWIARGSFNYFTDKQQLSFIGYGNNINEANYSWNDYSEFKGQSMTTGFDSGDFGFSSGRYGGRTMRFSSYSGDDSGFAKNGGAGVNYNFYDKKIKFNAGYFYTRNYNYSNQYTNRQTFLKDTTYCRIDTSKNDNIRNNHSFSTRFEYDIDSNNNIVLRADVTYSTTNIETLKDQLFQTADYLLWINRNSINNKNNDNNINLNSLAIYTHRFKKKGRVFAISGAYNFINEKSLEDIDNLNTFFYLTQEEQIKFIIKNDKNLKNNTAKSSLLYVESLGKKFTLQGFYNFNVNFRNNTNISFDENKFSVDSLWLDYKNNVFYNRAGASLNFGYNGINILTGGAFQNLMLYGIKTLKTSNDSKNFSYSNFIPYFEANIELPKNFRVSLDYSYSVEEPAMGYLFPMPNLSNNLYKTLGNPELKPERSHQTSARLSYWNSGSMSNFSLSGSAYFYENQIVYNQTTEFVDTVGYITTSTPVNLNGGNRFSTYFWSNFPIVKTILTMNISANASIRKSPIFINMIENITNTKSLGGGLGFNITAGEKLNFYTNGNISSNWTSYSIQTDRNQRYMNYSTSLSFKWQIFKKTFFEGTYKFSNYNNSRLDFSQNIHGLNVSIRQVVGKKNQWEFRLAGIDLLNQNQYIRQTAATNYIEYNTSPTLARYYLLTAAYNLRGFDIGAEKNTKMRVRNQVN